MKLKSNSGSFENAPEGAQQGVVVDVVDMGIRQDNFHPNGVHKMALAFQTEELMENGQPFVVRTYPLTASLDRKANLYKIIESIRGKFKPEDFDKDGEFDIDSIIGTNCMITVTHSANKTDPSKIYANVTSVGQLPKKNTTVLEPTKEYVRVQDRADAESFDVEKLEGSNDPLDAAF